MIDWVVTCLALNVYFEARGEPVEGQVAVALVTLNRARLSGCEVCDVVFAHKQMSWVHELGYEKRVPRSITQTRSWERSREVALASMYMQDFTSGATHFHTTEVRPFWRYDVNMHFVGEWGRHIFYRQDGWSASCKAGKFKEVE